jgi:hypothetical protein
MKTFSRLIVPVLMAAALSTTCAVAQNAGASTAAPGAPPAAGGPGPGGWGKRERPSAETIQRIQDGKIAFALAALKLDAAQQKLWTPVEAEIRSAQAARVKMMEAWGDRKPGDPRPSMAERMTKMAETMAARAERAKTFAAVFAPFHASLTDAQKAVIGPVMAELGGGKRGGQGQQAGWGGRRAPGGPGGAPQ